MALRFGDSRAERGSSRSVFEDLRTTDVVLAGNSSVPIEAVTGGRPAIYVAELDFGGWGLHRFVREGLICPLGGEDEIDCDALLRRYQDAKWVPS